MDSSIARRSDHPIAYLFTIGTYGMRLHGGKRDTVDRAHNKYGEPFILEETARRRWERDMMRGSPIVLTGAQAAFLETTLPAIAASGGWELHAAAAARDHVHVVLSCDVDPGVTRRLLKRFMSKELSQRFDPPAIRWWAEGGSIRWIWKPEQLDDAINYVVRQRSTPPQS